jgi:hypothetical protein
MRKNSIYNLAACLAAAFLPVMAGAAPQPKTDLHDLNMYAIDNDPPVRLLRYSFYSETYMVIANLVDQHGDTPIDLEAICYIPSGPDKGFYAPTNRNDYDKPAILYKIEPLTGDCYKYDNDIGYPYVVGMVAVQTAPGVWSILATQSGGDDKALIMIDPATGVGTEIMELENTYEGLAMARDGTLYGMALDSDDDSQLFIIDPSSDSETSVGPAMDRGRIESLEFAFGEVVDAIDTNGLVPPSWTMNGLLMGFSDGENEFLIINPLNGDMVPYAPPFLDGTTTDGEGIALFTLRQDPYSAVLADIFD